MIIKKVAISDDDIEEIKEFVVKSYQTNLDKYKKRNQFDEKKIKNDIYIGKLAEYAVYYLYKNRKGCEVKKPDIEVYEAKYKSFDADLKYNKNNKEFHVHVKAQWIKQSNIFGKSWSFQCEDSLVTRPKQNELIVLCSVISPKIVEVIQPIKATKLVDVYGEPKLNKLKGIKKVLYYDDILKIKNYIY